MWRARRFFLKIWTLVHSGRAERELAREVEAHLALLADDFRRRGMSAEQALLAARRVYGNVEQAKEWQRAERSFAWIEQVWADLRYAGRNLARNPGFTLVVILTLALGIGVNATVFSAYNAVALKPLPVADPGEVVRLERWFQHPSLGELQYAFSYPEYAVCRDRCRAFASVVAASWPRQVLLEGAGRGAPHPEMAAAQLVSANYFAGLGIALPLGRSFLPEEDRLAGGNAVAVISYPFWQRRFQGSPRALGRLVKVNGTALTVVGVAPADFTGTSTLPQVPDLWVPLSMQAQVAPGSDWLHEPDNRQWQILARLKASTTAARAQAETGSLLLRFDQTFRHTDETIAITLQRTAAFGNTDDPRFKTFVAALLLLVGLVLLVACANVANMLLARGTARQKEIGVRLALGAGRARIVRQLLTESILLACLGGAAGVLASLWSTRLLWLSLQQLFAGLFAGNVVFQIDLRPDGRVFAYALLLSFFTAILFGLWPAWQASRPAIAATFKDAAPNRSRTAGRSRLRGALVAMQVGVSVLLLILTSLLLRGLLRSQEANPGYQTQGVVLLSGDFGLDVAQAAARERRLLGPLENLPGIRSAALGTIPLLGTWTPPILVERPGAETAGVQRPGASGTGSNGKVLASSASATYFETLGIPLLKGRAFTPREAAQGAHVAVISQAAARRFWPHEDPLGRRFKLDLQFRNEFTEFEVVGLAADVRFANLTRTDPTHIYLPTAPGEFYGILLRAHGDAETALAAVRTTVSETDRTLLPGMRLMTLENGPLHLQKSLARMCASYAGMLAAVALALAAVGLYGVMTYLVNQRVPEIGLRLALGASVPNILATVLGEGLRSALCGLAAGSVVATALVWLVHRTLVLPGTADFFYGVPFYDPVTFLGVAAFLLLLAGIAAFVPARLAMRVDPMAALRYE